MSRRHGLVLLALGALWGCDSEGLAPDAETSLSLQIGTAAGFSSAADAGLIRLEGPSTRAPISIQPGETRTIDGLQPGTYGVTLEALLQGRVESYAETTVAVVAGQNRQANLILRSFTPGFLTVPAEASPGVPFTVQFGAVTDAESYVVEWDDDPGFSGASSVTSATTTADVTVDGAGTHFVRVRARTRFGTDGVPTAAREVTAINQPPTATISQPPDQSTFAGAEPISFEGTAEDPEDGTLTGGALVWTSSIDGEIGTGASFSRSDLSLGVHTITLTATDGDGATGTDVRTITVEAVGAPTVRVGEAPSSTAEVGGQVGLPIFLDLSQTGGLEVREVEIVLSFDREIFGAESWSIVSQNFAIPEDEGQIDGTTQTVRLVLTRGGDFASSATLALLTLDPARVGAGAVDVVVVSAAGPDGSAIDPGLFNAVGHSVTIQQGNPTVQTLQPGSQVEGLEGGVLYFRVPVPGEATQTPAPVGGEPLVVPGGRGPVHPRPGPSGDVRPGPFEAAADRGLARPASQVRVLTRTLADARAEPDPSAAALAVGQTLRVQIVGGTGDADLYLRLGELPTPNDFDCRPFRNGNEEECNAIDPGDGDWFVMIRPFGVLNAYTGLTLAASLFEAVSITTTDLPTGVLGTPYEASLAAADGDGTYEWSVVSGDLPPGMSLAEDGTLSGTPGAAGDFTFTVQVVSASKAAEAEFTLTILQAATPFAYFSLQDRADIDNFTVTNLSGGGVQTSKLGTGSYQIAFEGIGSGTLGSSFTAYVTTLAASANPELGSPDPTCTLTNLNAAHPITAIVHCADVVTGDPVDARFRLMVVGDNVLAGTGAPGQAGGFSAHNSGPAPSYTPHPTFSWNSGNAGQSVSYRDDVDGVVRHELGISIAAPFALLVSTVGEHGCVLWDGSSTAIDVRCRLRNGTITDQHNHLAMSLQGGRPGQPYGYAFVQGSALNGTFSRNPAGTIDVLPQGAGKWRVTFNGMEVQDFPAVDVTPISGGWVYCSQFFAGNGPVSIDVACYDASGSFVDVGFFVTVLR